MRFGCWESGWGTVVDVLENSRNGTVVLVLDVEAGETGEGYRATARVLRFAEVGRSLPAVGDGLAVEACPARRAARLATPASPLGRVLAGFPAWPLVLG